MHDTIIPVHSPAFLNLHLKLCPEYENELRGWRLEKLAQNPF
jgi:predicted metal-dependent hydrolase